MCGSVCGRKSLYVPVLSSTKATIDSLTVSVFCGLVKVAPCDIWLCTSHNVEDINSQIAGEFPLPCPLPKIGNCTQCEYADGDMPFIVRRWN